MNTPQKSDGSGVAAPEPSKPTTTKEIGIPMMTHHDDNPHPVDPTGPLTIDAKITPIARLREAVAEVDPADITPTDARAILDLFARAAKSESLFGISMRAHDPVGGER